MARLIDSGRLAYAAILCILSIVLVVETLHWQWMWDDSIMRYANFLMDHGMVLYRDIIDMNMPGAFLMEGWALHLFGTSDIAARMYEYSLLLTLTVAMVTIARKYDWFAGLFAGVLFALIHTGEGTQNAVQRDEIMTVLLLVSYALIFVALRRGQPLLLLPFGFVSALALSLKPTCAPVPVVLLLMAAVTLKKREERVPPYVGYAMGGFGLAALIFVDFFWRTHAFQGFVETMHILLPAYAATEHVTILHMMKIMLDRGFQLIFFLGLTTALIRRDWNDWERWALAFGVLFGAASFLVQQKGLNYHRYPLYAFLLLWAGLEFSLALRDRGPVRLVGIAGLSFGVLVLAPVYAHRITQAKQVMPIARAIQKDLSDLGGTKLQGKVQCMDIVAGCVEALDRLGLVQSTGFISDLMLFPPNRDKSLPTYQSLFMQKLTTAPPSVIVLTDAWMSQPVSFDKIDSFPEFRRYLDEHYSLLLSRKFQQAPRVIADNSYRIYVLTGHPSSR